MRAHYELTKLLITVLTYPHPSKQHQETICTAGITENGEWVRLYPIDYRYQPQTSQFRKWQWIQLDLAPYAYGNDQRPESRKPDLKSLEILGEFLSTKNNWERRRELIDRMPHHTLHQLEQLYDQNRTSLGIICPKRVLDLVVTPTDRKWPEKY